jgi:hypothetical protein
MAFRLAAPHLHFLEERRVWVCESSCGRLLPDCRSRVEEVDPEVGVVALYGLRDVLHGRNVERDGHAEDGHDDSLIFAVCDKNKQKNMLG